jgi:hypothetical protein
MELVLLGALEVADEDHGRTFRSSNFFNPGNLSMMKVRQPNVLRKLIVDFQPRYASYRIVPSNTFTGT